MCENTGIYENKQNIINYCLYFHHSLIHFQQFWFEFDNIFIITVIIFLFLILYNYQFYFKFLAR